MSQPPNPPKSSSQAQKTASGQQRSKLQSLLQLLSQLAGILLALVPVLLNLLRQVGQLALAGLGGLAKLWAAALPKIRAILPTAWRTKLSDAVLTAIAIGLLALLLWLPTVIFMDHKAIAEISSPSEPSAKPIETAKPDPNAKRMAAIQEQIAEISAAYTENLIEAVQANFSRNRLTVRVNDNWYSLEPGQREQLANDLLKRSQKLTFKTLEIADLEGTLLARTPVVGKQMVLLATVKA